MGFPHALVVNCYEESEEENPQIQKKVNKFSNENI